MGSTVDPNQFFKSLEVSDTFCVPGKAVINNLVVRKLTYDTLVASPPALLAASPPAPHFQAFAAPPAPPPAFFSVETTCTIPLALQGTGVWMDLRECAFFTDITPPRIKGQGHVAISEDNLNLYVTEAGVYKIDCNIRVGSCGYGQHGFEVGLGICGNQPERAISSCQSFGATLDMSGSAVGTTLLDIPEACVVQLYLRDDSSPATDANIFQGTLLFTRIL